jgi:hypothetical protein
VKSVDAVVTVAGIPVLIVLFIMVTATKNGNDMLGVGWFCNTLATTVVVAADVFMMGMELF